MYLAYYRHYCAQKRHQSIPLDQSAYFNDRYMTAIDLEFQISDDSSSATGAGYTEGRSFGEVTGDQEYEGNFQYILLTNVLFYGPDDTPSIQCSVGLRFPSMSQQN